LNGSYGHTEQTDIEKCAGTVANSYRERKRVREREKEREREREKEEMK
jgi:hypothetical protein